MQRNYEAEPDCDLFVRGTIDLRVPGEPVSLIKFCIFKDAGEKKPLYAEEVRALRAGIVIEADICTAEDQARRQCYVQRLVELRESFQKSI